MESSSIYRDETAKPFGPWHSLVIVLLGHVVAVLIALAVYFALAPERGEPFSKSPMAPAVLITGQIVLLAVIILAGWRRFGGGVARYLALVKTQTRWLWLFPILYAGTVWVLARLAVGRSLDLGSSLGLDALAPSTWIYALLALVVAEVTYRGFLFSGFAASRVGPFGAVVLTAALPTVIFLIASVVAGSVAFAAGVLLGVVRLRSGSLVPALMGHALTLLSAALHVLCCHAG